MNVSYVPPGKPVMLTEYGADTVAGIHMEPSMVFTEEYQVTEPYKMEPSVDS